MNDHQQTGGDVIGVAVIQISRRWFVVAEHAEAGGVVGNPHRAIPCDPAEIRNRVVLPWEDAGNRDWSSAEREAFDRGVDAVLALLGLHS